MSYFLCIMINLEDYSAKFFCISPFMKQTLSLICALAATLIWGTTFIAQDQGMGHIGPLTFNAVRFFFGFLVLLPLAFIFEFSLTNIQIITEKRVIPNLIYIGLFLFLGSILQQYSLLYTDVANSAFFTILYVAFVPLIAFFLYSKRIHWSVWPSILACLIGGYFLSEFSNAIVRKGDTLVVVGALFWGLHIVFISKILLIFNFPLLIASIQCLVVAILSFILALIFEEFLIQNIQLEISEILYAGILSSGFGFLLQIYGQRFISPAPVAIIFSMEGVFAAIAAWFFLEQILNFDQILGCFFILLGVLISQLCPMISRKYSSD